MRERHLKVRSLKVGAGGYWRIHQRHWDAYFDMHPHWRHVVLTQKLETQWSVGSWWVVKGFQSGHPTNMRQYQTKPEPSLLRAFNTYEQALGLYEELESRLVIDHAAFALGV